MDVLLTTATRAHNPASIKAIERLFTVSEPLGIAYLAAVLKQSGHHVEVLDCAAEGYTSVELDAFLAKKRYDLVGISTYTPDWYVTKLNLPMIRRRQPSAKIVLGGPHINSMVNAGLGTHLFEDGAEFDLAVYGEGEQTLAEIADTLQGKGAFSGIDGVVWRDQSGQVVVNPSRELIKDLDQIPYPALEELPLSKYSRTPSSYRRQPVRSLLTARGCPYSCLFCDRGAFGSSVRRRTIGNVIGEVDRLVKQFGTRELRIWDDVFTMDERSTIEICEALKPYRLSWSCNGRVNRITPSMLTHMKDAGCWAVDFGIESGNDGILKVVHKRFTTQEAAASIRMVKNAGIQVRAFFILGFPEETLETVHDTIKFSLSNPIDYATYYLPQAYPGTQLYEIAKQQGVLEQDLSKYLITGNEASYVNPVIGRERLQALQRSAYRGFYGRPSYVARMLANISSWDDVVRYWHAGAGYLQLLIGMHE